MTFVKNMFLHPMMRKYHFNQFQDILLIFLGNHALKENGICNTYMVEHFREGPLYILQARLPGTDHCDSNNILKSTFLDRIKKLQKYCIKADNQSMQYIVLQVLPV